MTTSIVVAYQFTPEALAKRVDILRGQSFTTPALYKDGVKAIATCREYRVAIEERRKLLKQDSLEYGRKVDAVAKQLTDIIAAVEEPLKVSKLEVDNAKARAKEAEQEAKRAAVEAEIRAKREAEEHALLVQRQADEERLRQERANFEAERKAAADERAKAAAELEAEREQMRAEREKHRAELRDLEQQRHLREEAARQAQVAVEAAALAERLAAEAEERRLNQLEYERQRQQRLAALEPDRVKLRAFAAKLEQFWSEASPQVQDDEAAALLCDMRSELDEWSEKLRTWEPS